MWEKLKRHKKQILIFVLFLVFGIPGAIHLLFKIDSNVEWLTAEWSAGELLLYYGSVLTLLGTMLLSSLALWQNQEMKLENEKYRDYLERRERNKNMPRFIIERFSSLDSQKNLNIRVCNVSDNTAYHVCVLGFKIYDKEIVLWDTAENFHEDFMDVHKMIDIHLDNPSMSNGSVLSFHICFQDKFFEEHDLCVCGRIDHRKIIFDLNENKS